jgi:hypothetical protein
MDNGDNGNTRALFFVDQVDYDRAIGGIQGRVPANPFNSPCTQGGCSRLKRLYSGFMADYPRYAIYYVPAPGSDLDRFGGHCSATTLIAERTCPFRTASRGSCRTGATCPRIHENMGFMPR